MLILKSLNYSYSDLEPYIDSDTMNLHHSKHLRAYVDKANMLLAESNADFNGNILDTYNQILNSNSAQKQALLNQLGQVYNHDFYFEGLIPADSYQAPNGKLKTLIESSFGDIKNLEQELQEEAMKIFGSGWQWLVLNKESGCLELCSSNNALFPDYNSYTHLLVIDVWEHAYYLKYQNRRAEYLSGIMNIINWKIVDDRLKQ